MVVKDSQNNVDIPLKKKQKVVKRVEVRTARVKGLNYKGSQIASAQIGSDYKGRMRMYQAFCAIHGTTYERIRRIQAHLFQKGIPPKDRRESHNNKPKKKVGNRITLEEKILTNTIFLKL
ncbi:hypothetical protein ILUMI_23140 [Ignelater luminosus]|uniref:Uncharacterized protein n=1 Tax=Ignelater luminosus TaxID=2038154 RepID=A0A8K0CD11_IGNLU|nr:hypothetical protein ILUMI_23140 [Ignelater luminosus]